jgi:hypothetical protein
VKKTLILASVAAFSMSVFAAAPAAKQEPARVLSMGDIVSLCKQKDNAQVTGFCNGFGQGVYDAYLVTRHPQKAPSKICVKQPAPQRQQVLDEFISWADKNAQYNDKPAAEAALRFLAERFPCGK